MILFSNFLDLISLSTILKIFHFIIIIIVSLTIIIFNLID
jgi:hypothetical protein